MFDPKEIRKDFPMYRNQIKMQGNVITKRKRQTLIVETMIFAITLTRSF